MCQKIPLSERLAIGVKNQPLAEKRQTRPVAPFNRWPQRVAPGRPSPALPAWPTLTVIMIVGLVLVAVTDALMPVGAWRTLAGCLAVILMFSTAAGWVRANRSALRQIDERGCEHPSLEIRYVASERHPPWTAGANRRPRAGIRARAIRQDPSRTRRN